MSELDTMFGNAAGLRYQRNCQSYVQDRSLMGMYRPWDGSMRIMAYPHVYADVTVLIGSGMNRVCMFGNEFSDTENPGGFIIAGSFDEAHEELVDHLVGTQVCDHGGDITDEQRSEGAPCDCEPASDGQWVYMIYDWIRPMRISVEQCLQAFLYSTSEYNMDRYERAGDIELAFEQGFMGTGMDGETLREALHGGDLGQLVRAYLEGMKLSRLVQHSKQAPYMGGLE